MAFHPELLASMIQAGGTVIAAAVGAGLIGRFIGSKQRLVEELELAIKDIEYLLAVEQRHCDVHKEHGSESNRNRVRTHVNELRGLSWSGRFTPGRQRDKQRNSQLGRRNKA